MCNLTGPKAPPSEVPLTAKSGSPPITVTPNRAPTFDAGNPENVPMPGPPRPEPTQFPGNYLGWQEGDPYDPMRRYGPQRQLPGLRPGIPAIPGLGGLYQ